MTAAVEARTPTPAAATRTPGFVDVLRAEWVKMVSVRSTWWTVATTFLIGAGLTILMCWGNADWLASPEADESPGSFITFGTMFTPILAVIFGALLVTTEYGTRMIHATFAAVPARGKVLTAKALLAGAVMFVVGLVTALVAYAGGNIFFEREGIGIALEGDMLRAVVGGGLALAGMAVFTVAVGFLLRHTAGTISLVLALIMILGNLVNIVPGELGEWLTKLMPGNAVMPVANVVSFNPNLLEPWTGFAVFLAECAAVVAVAWVMLRRRDA